MAFADVGDLLRLEPPNAAAFEMAGPFAGGIETGPGNLVVRARDSFVRMARLSEQFRLVLEKNLPVAAGLGGGSADAAATLRLLNRAFPRLDERQLLELAAELGADVPACLTSQPLLAEGWGKQISPAPHLPELPCVLVNPGIPSATADVFAAYDRSSPRAANRPDMPLAFKDPQALVRFLVECRNDLEQPAIERAPQIAGALEVLREAPHCRLARLSGSGATAFGLCDTTLAAQQLAAEVMAHQPRWWVRACVLRGSGA